MKKWKLIVGLLVLAVMVSGCTRAREAAPAQDSNMLIVVYSLSGNTNTVAQYIQDLTGADTFELELVEPYSEVYEETLERSLREREAGELPPLAGTIDDFAGYDVIFIGSPNWFGTLSLPILSFLASHDLSGKIIVPFITYGGGGLQNTITDLSALLPNETILEAFGIAGAEAHNSQSDIALWLEGIGLLN